MRTFSIAVLTGLLGLVLGFVLGEIVTKAQGVSDFEGMRGYAIVFLITPAAIILGLVVGTIVAKKVPDPGTAGYFKALGISLLITGATCGAIAAFQLWRVPKPPILGGQNLDLQFEIRMPAGRTAPDSSDQSFSVVFISDGDMKGRVGGELDYPRIRQDEGRVVIPGTLPLVASTRNRSLAINDGNAKGYWWDLPLKAKPDSSDMEWTAWAPRGTESVSSDIRGTNGFQLRYRVAARK